jgi:methylase of polypeptide subunit release factors
MYEASPKDVYDFEPKQALESGRDGLDHYHRLLEELVEKTNYYRSFFLLFEISPEQSVILQQEILRLLPKSTTEIIPDLSGRDRLIQASFPY